MKKFAKLKEIAIAMKPLRQTHRFFHVAFIVEKKFIRAIGWNNMVKTHPMTIRYPYQPAAKTHAEMSAILKMKGACLKNMTLVVIRLNSDNEMKQSKPCLGCQAFIKEVGVGSVWYSDEDQLFHKLK